MNRFLPFLAWWPSVGAHTLRADLLAGLVGAALVLPQGIAFATLAGMPVEYGLYCAMLPTAVAALFGSSLHAVSGPTNAVSLFVFAALSPIAAPGGAEYVSLALTLRSLGSRWFCQQLMLRVSGHFGLTVTMRERVRRFSEMVWHSFVGRSRSSNVWLLGSALRFRGSRSLLMKH